MVASSASLVLASTLAVGPNLAAERIAVSLAVSLAVTSAQSAEDEPGGETPEDAARNNGWDDPVPAEDPTADSAPTGEVAPTTEPAPLPTPVVTPTGQTQTIDDIVVPSRTGNGLLIAAGILGVGGWAVMGARMAIIRNGCRSDAFADDDPFTAEDATMAFGDGLGCVSARAKTVGLWVLGASFNVGAWGLGGGAGLVKGQYDAARLVKEGAPKRNGKLFIGVGAGVLALGVVGRVLTTVTRINRIDRVTQHCFATEATLTYSDFLDCYAGRNQLHFFSTQITSTAIGAGIGMLSYGAAHLKHEKNYRRIYEKEPKVTFRISPQLSRRYTGGALEMRF